MALNSKQQMFVNEYLKCFNATEAYAITYPNVTRATAGANGHELLKNTEISAAIKIRLSESAMSADEVLMRLAEQARGEHSKYISQEGCVKIADLVADGKAHLIKEIEEAKDGTTKYKFYDAQSALNTLAKHHGLLTDKTEITGAGGQPFSITIDR